MATADTKKAYNLDGTILEACSCASPCPCWIGDDPDGGKCDAFNAYHINRGSINGVDVSSLSLVEVAQIPGNVLKGNWRVVIYIDDKATYEQQQVVLDAFSGKLGGPLGALAGLIGERITIRPAPIEYRVESGKGTLRIKDALYAEISQYTDANGRPTTLHDTMFSTIPGSPAYVSKAEHHRVNLPEYGMVWEFSGRNAIQGNFHFEA